MKISRLTVQNFRSLKYVSLDFEQYTCLVGPNGSGKSAIIKALNLFFHQHPDGPDSKRQINEEDFYQKRTHKPIVVTIVFNDLSDQAANDLADYVRQKELHVSTKVEFDEDAGVATVSQHGIRLGIKQFAGFFEAKKSKMPKAELTKLFNSYKAVHPGIGRGGTISQMEESVREFEESRSDLCEPIPSSDHFYGATRGKNLLRRHVQWIYVAAVKDAAAEEIEGRNTALGQLLERAVRPAMDFGDQIQQLRVAARQGFKKLITNRQSDLDEMSNRLQSRMDTWGHPNSSVRVTWQDDANSVHIDPPQAAIKLGEGAFEGSVSKFGHGLQRSFLLAILDELASSHEDGPTLILACEEPELYQHPPQARHLASVLQHLAAKSGQVIVATHNPVFVVPEDPASVRLCHIDRSTSATQVASTSAAQIVKLLGEVLGKDPDPERGGMAKIHAALRASISEIFFAPRVVLVEGYEDLAYLETYLHLLRLKDEFRSQGCHIVPCQGKRGIIRPLAICKLLGIPVKVMIDSDSQESRSNRRQMHIDENLALLKLCDASDSNPIPADTFWSNSLVLWGADLQEVVSNEIGIEHWRRIKQSCEQEFGFVGQMSKNPLFIASIVNRAWGENKKSPSLERFCRMLVAD